MKKKIESELISIAHRLLKLKKPTETVKLQEEVKKLYDQLTILRFYEENIALVSAEISQENLEEKLEKIVVGTINIDEDDLDEPIDEFENPNQTEVLGLAGKESIININHGVMANEIINHNALPEIETEEKPIEILVIETEATTEEKPEEALFVEENKKTEEIIGTKASKQITIDDIFVHDYQDSFFEKKETTTIIKEEAIEAPKVTTEKPVFNQNDKVFGKAIVLGLNDKIAFEKNLFNNNTDDLNRVLSQLNTFTNLQDAKSFVLDFVKPDYNNWLNKEEFEARFLEIVENKFN